MSLLHSVRPSGLKKEKFRLFEYGVEREITHFSNDDAPLSAGWKQQHAEQDLKVGGGCWRVPEGTNPEDDFFLIRFG